MRRLALFRVAQYTIVRGLSLALMVAIGIFLSIIVINYGGYIDRIAEANIDGAIMGFAMAGGFRDVPEDQQEQVMADMHWQMEEAAGLHLPFLLRCARWWVDAVSFDFGEGQGVVMLSGPALEHHAVRGIILERLPATLLLSGITNLLLFGASVYLALTLSRHYGSLLDKLTVALSPLSAAPNWIYGVILVVIFGAQLHWLPLSGMYDDLPPETSWGYVPIVLKHMVLPAAAIALSTFFQSVYAWRTFYVMQIEEDHVDMARAMGLPPAMVERRYILRPTLPFLLTSFTLMLITFWQSTIALETFFDWPGIGSLLLFAIRANNRGVTVGVIVMFAYLLAVTIFLLDVAYALVDPRVRLGGGGAPRELAAPRKRRGLLAWRRRPSPRPAVVAPALAQPAARPRPVRRRLSPAARLRGAVRAVGRGLAQVIRYPSVTLGLLLVLALFGLAAYTLITIPHAQAIRLWQGQEHSWARNPKNAMPAWVNHFRSDTLPESIIMSSQAGSASDPQGRAGSPPGLGSASDPQGRAGSPPGPGEGFREATKVVSAVSDDMTEIAITFDFDYPYDGFPQDLLVNLTSRYSEKRPHVVLEWQTPDGRQLEVGNFSITSDHAYYVNDDERLARKLNDKPLHAMFADPAADSALQGHYRLLVRGFVFEDAADLDAEMVLHGQVYGLAGTDHRRRDLVLPLMWGAPVALAFGLGGAVATSLVTMFLAATGVWFGGWVDSLIQRITEVNMILPALPIALMVYFLYSKSVWAILGVMILLGFFGSAIKNYRAAFLQIRESPYIEAAQAYGAGNWRIILRYLVPRILPILLPQMVIMVPGFVFLEATLAYLGVSDVNLPTWGKVIFDALTNGAFRGYFYWVLEPVVLLLLTGLAFALLGLALERVYNPRLRKR